MIRYQISNKGYSGTNYIICVTLSYLRKVWNSWKSCISQFYSVHFLGKTSYKYARLDQYRIFDYLHLKWFVLFVLKSKIHLIFYNKIYDQVDTCVWLIPVFGFMGATRRFATLGLVSWKTCRFSDFESNFWIIFLCLCISCLKISFKEVVSSILIQLSILLKHTIFWKFYAFTIPVMCHSKLMSQIFGSFGTENESLWVQSTLLPGKSATEF